MFRNYFLFPLVPKSAGRLFIKFLHSTMPFLTFFGRPQLVYLKGPKGYFKSCQYERNLFKAHIFSIHGFKLFKSFRSRDHVFYHHKQKPRTERVAEKKSTRQNILVCSEHLFVSTFIGSTKSTYKF